MNSVPVAAALTVDLPAKAAACERRPEKWEQRFRSLLDAGIIKILQPPGAEYTQQMHSLSGYSDAPAMAHHCLRFLKPALHSGYAAGIDLSNVDPGDFRGWLQGFCQGLEAGLTDMAPGGVRLLFSLCISHPGLKDFLQLRGRQALGYPHLAVRFGPDPGHYRGQPWQELMVLSHTDCRLKLVPAMTFGALSGLHTAERGQCVMPCSLFEVAAGSAWMALEIDATRLTTPARLRSQLSLCLRFADNLIDVQQWPVPAQKLDALLNRRVALHIGNLGQMVLNGGLNPASFTTLRRLQRWLWFVRKSFIRESNLLAIHRGPFPAFGARELVNNLAPRYGIADANRIVRNRAVRHRHLLALSPYAVFPDALNTEADERWLNLVPAIACADTLSMYGQDPRKRLGLNAWSRLLQMTGALAGRSHTCAQNYLS